MVSLLPQSELLKVFLLYLLIIGVNLLCESDNRLLTLLNVCMPLLQYSFKSIYFPLSAVAELLNLKSAHSLVILCSYAWQKTHQVLLNHVSV